VPNARYRLVCFDLDGTLVTGLDYVWTMMHRHFRTDAKARREAKQAFRSGRLAYADWFHHDIVLLRAAGATRDALARPSMPCVTAAPSSPSSPAPSICCSTSPCPARPSITC
jgi:hypothetical protein